MALQLILPVVVPRALVLWGLIRLVAAAVPLAAGAPAGSMPPWPIGVICLVAVVGMIDIRVRGERILWANLAVMPAALAIAYTAPAILAETLLMILLR